jgi:hypothetical protein
MKRWGDALVGSLRVVICEIDHDDNGVLDSSDLKISIVDDIFNTTELAVMAGALDDLDLSDPTPADFDEVIAVIRE